jgi:hypothetical protein
MARNKKGKNFLGKIFYGIKRIPVHISVFIILLYKRIISPLLPSACRFYPTCSQYAVEALKKYGFVKGIYLAIKRVCRCHPFNKGGHDPVP